MYALTLTYLLPLLVALQSTHAAPRRWGNDRTWVRPTPAKVAPPPAGPVVLPAPAPAPVPAPAPAPAPQPSQGGSNPPPAADGAEQHNVELINNCGSGNPVFLAAGISTRSAGLISGPVLGGVAWMDGYADCQSSGVNCGTVEFTLTNPGGGGMQNAINYSLLDGTDRTQGTGLGNHQYKYPMYFEFTGSCTNKAPGKCTGQSKAQCPGVFLGDETEGGAPVQSLASNAGIRITFC